MKWLHFGKAVNDFDYYQFTIHCTNRFYCSSMQVESTINQRDDGNYSKGEEKEGRREKYIIDTYYHEQYDSHLCWNTV